MTYVTAFHCIGGIAMSADTQESWGEYKVYSEKIAIVQDRSYPLAVGGAGFSDLIECLSDEIIQRASEEKPATKRALKRMLKAAIAHVYAEDVPTLVLRKQHRTPELVIAAFTGEGPCIFTTKGRRVLGEAQSAIIGYGTPINWTLLKRLYRPSLPMQQAVMLAIYLASISKTTDDGVSGDTTVAVVRDNGAWLEWQPHVASAEAHIHHFLKLIDSLFLASVDISIPPSRFPEVLQQFSGDVASLRQSFLNQTAAISLQREFSDPQYAGEPYNKIFLGAITEMRDGGSLMTREETEEEKSLHRQMFQAMRESHNQVAGRQFASMIQGRQPLYLGEERVHVRGVAGPVEDSANSSSVG